MTEYISHISFNKIKHSSYRSPSQGLSRTRVTATDCPIYSSYEQSLHSSSDCSLNSKLSVFWYKAFYSYIGRSKRSIGRKREVRNQTALLLPALNSWKKQLQAETVIFFIHACLPALYPEIGTGVLGSSVQRNPYAFFK